MNDAPKFVLLQEVEGQFPRVVRLLYDSPGDRATLKRARGVALPQSGLNGNARIFVCEVREVVAAK